jgi:hypothetical protein
VIQNIEMMDRETALPYMRLWLSVIQRGIEDIIYCKDGSELQLDAIRFVSGAYFEEICQNIGLEPEALRDGLIKVLNERKKL